jgi:hypothetical protein
MTSYTAERTAELNERADAISALQPGDGVTVSVWSDADAYTIVRATRTRIVAREDSATLDPSFKPEIIPGGFLGHCTNQREQTYSYSPNPQGRLVTVTLRRWRDEEGNERRMWKAAGSSISARGGSVVPGRHKFHDYNF